MIASLVRLYHRVRSFLHQPPTHNEVIAESQRLRHDMDDQIKLRRRDAAATRVEQTELRRTIRQNFIEVEMRPDLRRKRGARP